MILLSKEFKFILNSFIKESAEHPSIKEFSTSLGGKLKYEHIFSIAAVFESENKLKTTLLSIIQLNPYGYTLSLNIDSYDNSISVELAIESAEYFDITIEDAQTVTEEILTTVKNNWEKLASKYGISREQTEQMRPAFDACYR